MRNKLALGQFVALLTITGIGFFATGCAGDRYSRSTGTYIDDKSVNARVKTELIRDPMVKGSEVDVETFRGNVQLNGFVSTEEQKQRANEIARNVSGVKWVQNNLVIKTEVPSAAGAPAVTTESSRAAASDSGVTAKGEWEKGVNDPGRTSPRSDLDDQTSTTQRETRTLTTPTQRMESASATPRNIEINASNGKATVRGVVSSEAQRASIERKLREVPGIDTVDNQLRIE